MCILLIVLQGGTIVVMLRPPRTDKRREHARKLEP